MMAAETLESPDDEKRWTGVELLACAVTQLLLVNVAYRIDLRRRAPLLSTSAWAIFFGLAVRLAASLGLRAHKAHSVALTLLLLLL